MKFRAVSNETKINYLLWSIKQEITREIEFLNALGFDPQPILDVVKHNIDKWDPVGLLVDDFPEDEYDGESRTIFIYIIKHFREIDSDSLSKAISKIFKKSFNVEFTKGAESVEIAISILSLLGPLE